MSQVMAESLSQAAKSNYGDDVNEDDYEAWLSKTKRNFAMGNRPMLWGSVSRTL